MKKSYLERFEERIEKTDTCWNWTGGVNDKGFGQFWLDGKNVLVHRLAYRIYVEHISRYVQVYHTCNNNRCVNPAHLEISKGMSQKHKDKIGNANRGRVIKPSKETGTKTSVYLYSEHLDIVSKAIREGKAVSTPDAVRKGLESL